MKTIKTFFFLLTVVVTAISCDAVDELTEIDVDTTITKDLVITVADGKTTFSESASISIDNEQVQDNLDRIEDLQITKLTYKILNKYSKSCKRKKQTKKSQQMFIFELKNDIFLLFFSDYLY